MRHVSQAEVAHALGMGRTNIGQIENGTVQENGDAKTDSYSGVFLTWIFMCDLQENHQHWMNFEKRVADVRLLSLKYRKVRCSGG